MDGTAEAFRTVCRATPATAPRACTPTTTVARHDQHLRFLDLCRELPGDATGGARDPRRPLLRPVLRPRGPRLPPGRGRPPARRRPSTQPYLDFADGIATATVAPEIAGRRGVRPGLPGEAASAATPGTRTPRSSRWRRRSAGACATSIICSAPCPTGPGCGRRRPTRCAAGVMEATLFFDELTTEVIADGKHLRRELLRLAYKVEGPGPAGPGDRLRCARSTCPTANTCSARSTAASRSASGRRRRHARRQGAGLRRHGHGPRRADVSSPRPGCRCPRRCGWRRLTPARIAGVDADVGSIEAGKRADLVVTDAELNVRAVYIGGRPFNGLDRSPRPRSGEGGWGERSVSPTADFADSLPPGPPPRSGEGGERSSFTMRVCVAALLVASVVHAGSPPDLWTRKAGGDWPRFLGPTGDGVSPETGILTTWPKEGSRSSGRPRWGWASPRRRSAGAGCSTSTGSGTTTGSPAGTPRPASSLEVRIPDRLRRPVRLQPRPAGLPGRGRRPRLHSRPGGDAPLPECGRRQADLAGGHPQGVPRPPELLRRRERAPRRGRPAHRRRRRQPEGPAADRPAGGQGGRHRAHRLRQADRQGGVPDDRRAGLVFEPGGGDGRRPAARAVLRPRRAGRVRPEDGQGGLPLPLAGQGPGERQRQQPGGRRRTGARSPSATAPGRRW